MVKFIIRKQHSIQEQTQLFFIAQDLVLVLNYNVLDLECMETPGKFASVINDLFVIFFI